MPKPAPLDYEPVTPRPRRNFSILWVIPGVLVLLFISALLLNPHGHSREYSYNRAKCSNNLRQIGLEIMMYCNDYKQQFPNEVGLLIPTQGLSAEVFVCPSSSDMKLQGASTQPAAMLLSSYYCSYVYVGAGMNSSAGTNDVIAFELPDNHGKDGGNVLYGDAHVSYEQFDVLVQLVGELEAGRNPPVIRVLTEGQAKTMYEQKWVPKLASIKNGSWAGSLPRSSPTTRPSAEAK